MLNHASGLLNNGNANQTFMNQIPNDLLSGAQPPMNPPPGLPSLNPIRQESHQPRNVSNLTVKQGKLVLI